MQIMLQKSRESQRVAQQPSSNHQRASLSSTPDARVSLQLPNHLERAKQKALSDSIQDITGVEHPTVEEQELIDRSPDQAKALCLTMTRIVYPLDDLLKCLTRDRTQLQFGRVFVDATVWKAVAESGESKAMSYIRKTQAVDPLWLRDTLRHRQVEILKIDSARYCADLFTKAVSNAVLAALLPIIGRS